MDPKTESSASVGTTSPSQFKYDGNNESMSPARENRPMIRLGDAFVPTRLDVMCGRGKMSHHHVGNHRFRDIIERNLKRYNKATNKITKSDVVTDIVESVRIDAAAIGGAGFVRQETSSGYWVEIGDTLAREKVGHALRDSIKNRKKRSERKPKVEPPFQYEKQQAMFHKQQHIFLKSLKEDMGKDHQETTDYVMDYFRGAKAAPAPKTPTTTATKASSNNKRKKKNDKKAAKITPIKQESFKQAPMSPPFARRITAEGDALVKLQEDAGFPVATSPIIRRVSTDDMDTPDDTPVLTEEHTPPPQPPSSGKDHSRRVSLTDVDYNNADLISQHHDDCGGMDGFVLQDDLSLPLFEDDAMILGDIVPDHATSVTPV